ncbi:hypothetical protein HPT27_07125 [Permianibacter sp. IMCC34836]|uniref:SRPBCC domain-containing protein n=1 Tax=Permianibacter fluminis TaxID=2738515 RepID=UPI001553851E|nr:SRPBCC domain-containing protein [Permianibacter fluminis]NQD36794.1 hypothetical protein [Permianibacter fluminis]
METSAPIVTADQATEVVITRLLNAPRELVFKAWTEPQHVMQWWGPTGFQNTDCQLDLREGGAFALHMTGPDGISYPCLGHYEEISPPERLVLIGEADDRHACGAGLPPRARITVTLVDFHGRTELTIHTRFESATGKQAAVAMGYRTGWEGAFARLADYLRAN